MPAAFTPEPNLRAMAGSAPMDPDFALTEAIPEALDGAAQLRRELNLLELRLRREVLVSRAERGSGRSDEFAGLYIPDEEIDRYLKDAEAAAPPPDELRLLDQRIEAEVEALSKAAASGRVEGKFLPIEHLREAFSLRPGEISILLACLAPDLDLRFERYYAYLQNDVARKRPCVQLLGRLFLESFRLRHLAISLRLGGIPGGPKTSRNLQGTWRRGIRVFAAQSP